MSATVAADRKPVATPRRRVLKRAGATPPAVVDARRTGGGNKTRLTMAIEELEAYPALAESRRRLLAATDRRAPVAAEIVAAVESDVALLIAVLRLANSREHRHSKIDSVVAAVELLGPRAIHAVASSMPTFDFFQSAGAWGQLSERFRLHALATQRAAGRIAMEVGYARRDSLVVASTLHDIGQLALIHAYQGYNGQLHQGAATPQERVRQERRELGLDHALLGGLLIRRWGLPASLADTIEHHHDPDARGEAAVVRLADMLAHYERGAPVSPGEMLESASVLGLGEQRLRGLMYALAGASSERRLPDEPCPLSGAELKVLRALARGQVYKEIAVGLKLSASTVRSHLHNIYRQLGVIDRAQAVILASERGWL
jgi:HD-like signal output (HDOD) protein/DNA-binding CsgD family transcriptional regulator